MALTRDEIGALIEAVVAAAKSPGTGGQGIMQGAALIQVLQRELAALEAPQTANVAQE